MSYAPVVVRWLRMILCASVLLAAAPAIAADDGKTVRLFTIGNSFSYNATTYLQQLAEAGGHKITIGTAAIGGASLHRHWKQVEKSEADPHGKAGRYGNGKTLKELLASQPWDYVTIQQASWLSHDYATYQPFADRLAAYVREHAPEAELLIHQTWAYRVDDPRFAGDPKPGQPATHVEMHEQLTAAYEQLAGAVGAEIVPVGDAFHLADTDTTWGYRPDESFDSAAAEPPALPDQTHSLHIGWRWHQNKDGSQKLTMDGHHAGIPGRYLAGCVFYEVLFDESVVGNPFIPDGLDPDYARFLQETAHAAMARHRAAASRLDIGSADAASSQR